MPSGSDEFPLQDEGAIPNLHYFRPDDECFLGPQPSTNSCHQFVLP